MYYKPSMVILATRDPVKLFLEETDNYFSKPDVEDILTQISFVLLNAQTDHHTELSRLPEVNRMRNQSFANEPVRYYRIKDATLKLGLSINELVRSLGLYQHDEQGNLEFPYFFAHLIGYDMVLDRLNNLD